MDLTPVIGRVARIPDRYRRFDVTAAGAASQYRIPAPLVDQLLDAGLPHRGGPPRFDREDLKTVVLMLRLPSPKRAALTAMAKALDAGSASGEIRRTVTVQGFCPQPGHAGDCAFTLAPALAREPVRARGPQAFEVELRLHGGRLCFDLSGAERQLLDELSRFEFHHIPYQLNQDLGFLAETGLADCTLANHFLADRGRELGVSIRAATGLFLARPFADRHFWVELRRAAGWLPADPFFITALVRWGVLDGHLWPPHRAPLGTYWTLDLHPTEQVISHRAATAPVPVDGEPQRLGPGYLFTR